MKYLYATITLFIFSYCNQIQKQDSENIELEGKILYISKCNSCHKIYDQSNFNYKEWDSILTIMQKKSRITNEQRIKIFNYLTNSTDSKIKN